MFLILPVGIITDHGIPSIEFANQLQERSMRDFAAKADVLRLRSILMNGIAMATRAIPLALATSVDTRKPTTDRPNNSEQQVDCYLALC